MEPIRNQQSIVDRIALEREIEQSLDDLLPAVKKMKEIGKGLHEKLEASTEKAYTLSNKTESTDARMEILEKREDVLIEKTNSSCTLF